jgi:hypothetical protein
MENLLHSSRNGLQSIGSFVIILMRWAPFTGVGAHPPKPPPLVDTWRSPSGLRFFFLCFLRWSSGGGYPFFSRQGRLFKHRWCNAISGDFTRCGGNCSNAFEDTRGWMSRPRDERAMRFGYTCADLLLRLFRSSLLVQICGSESIAFFATAFSAAWSPLVSRY